MLYAKNKENECLYPVDLEKPSFLQDQSSSSISALGTSRSRKDSSKKWKAR